MAPYDETSGSSDAVALISLSLLVGLTLLVASLSAAVCNWFLSTKHFDGRDGKRTRSVDVGGGSGPTDAYDVHQSQGSGQASECPSSSGHPTETAWGTVMLDHYGGSVQNQQHFSRSLEDDGVKHKIFLSYSGAQKGFTEQLFEDLKRRGSIPFFDQTRHSLPKGKDFAPLIKEAARHCHVAVIVLSKEFLCSKWPMIELAEFHDAQQAENPRLKMFPLFYKLSVEDLKERAIEELWMPIWRELASTDERIDVEKWSDAVKALRKVNGLLFGRKGLSEVGYRKDIVRSILELSPPELLYGSSWEGSEEEGPVVDRKVIDGPPHQGTAQVVMVAASSNPGKRKAEAEYTEDGPVSPSRKNQQPAISEADKAVNDRTASKLYLANVIVPAVGLSMIFISCLEFMFSTDISSFIFASFFLVMLAWFIWQGISNMLKSKLVWKWKIWQILGIIFKPNNSKLLKFADFVRKAFPHLAPCNALHDEVSCFATTSKYVARTHGGGILGLPNSCQYSIVGLDSHSKENFSNQRFQIGAGSVHVTKLIEDQYHFKCKVRGKYLEDFVVITDWESIATILYILEFWRTSPKLGVIENIIHEGSTIYCHALSIKEIVEGVNKSLDYFSIFQLQEEKCFFVGCGRGCISMSDEKTDGKDLTTSTISAIILAIGAYYQLQDNYKKVAIVVSLVIPICLATIIFFMDFFGLLFKQSCFYGLCTILCCTSGNLRLGVYLWLKKGGYSLAYCDDFRPDQLRIVDNEREVIYLYKSLYKSRNKLAMKQEPDWATFPNINIYNLDTSDVWHIKNNDIKFQLYKDPNNLDVVVFRMEYPYSNCMMKSKRMVLARSTHDRTQRGSLTGTMTTEVSLDGEAATYNWPVGSFYLFVFLMLKWRGMKHGVIETWEDFMFRTYYHVFSTHGLASHIEKHKLVSYYLLLGDQQPSTP